MSKIAMRLTKRAVDAAKPEAAKYILWDRDLPSFGLRVMPSGVKSFILRYRVGKGRTAKGRSVTIGKVGEMTCEAARRLAKDFKAEARLGLDPEEERRPEVKGMTFADLLEQWRVHAAHINRRTGAIRRADNVKLDVDRLTIHALPILGKHEIAELKRSDINFLRDEISRGATSVKKKTKPRGVRNVTGGAGTAARTVAVLSSVFSYAIDEELIEINPCRGVKVKPAGRSERFLSEAEAARLGEVLNGWDTDRASQTAVMIIRLLSVTGARRGEITNLKWSEIDFDQGFLRLGESKTGLSIRPLSAMAVRMLEGIPKRNKIWVFPAASGGGPFQGLGKIWREVRKKADLEDVRLHDLRHSFASFGAANGLSLPMIGALLGHRNMATTQRYAHLTNDAARKAADGIADIIGQALGVSGSGLDNQT